MAGNIAIFEGNGRINIAIKDEDGNVVYSIQGVGGQVTIDDKASTVLGYLKKLDPDKYGAIRLIAATDEFEANTPINGAKDNIIVEQEVEGSGKVEGDATPDSSWTKTQLKEYMDTNSISYNSGDTKQDLLDKIAAN